MLQLQQASAGLHTASHEGRLAGVLVPAMSGCPDCKTAWVIVSPTALGTCAACGMAMVILTADQVAVATDRHHA